MDTDDNCGFIINRRALSRKVAWRIIPLIFILYIISYLDRANAGFAKDQMQKMPGFEDPAVFGWGFGIFFVGYLILEIPGALLVEHWSARKWFTRILLTWGVCSMGMALVRQPWQFYTMRFLLGLAEAGFFPGVIVYFTHWFPRAERGRALAGLVLGVPFSLALGARVSGYLLEVHWFGLAGWQWLFLAEGLPAVLMGIVVFFLLTDRPRDAAWLTAAERDWLEQTLEDERRTAALGGAEPARGPKQTYCLATGPGDHGSQHGCLRLDFLAARRDQRDAVEPERRRYRISQLGQPGLRLRSVGRMVVGTIVRPHRGAQMALRGGDGRRGCLLGGQRDSGHPWAWVFACLCLTGFFSYFWPSPFWVLPTLALSSSEAAVAIGFINICANIAGLIGSPVVGQLQESSLQ